MHLSFTKDEVATMIYHVEKGSYLHGKLSRAFGVDTRRGLLYLSTGEIVLTDKDAPKDRFGVRVVFLRTQKGYVYIEE